ncbi:YjcZ family sporulation protein [Neobacillus drentensis]
MYYGHGGCGYPAYPAGGCGYPAYPVGGCGIGSGFALIVVLFILLIIIGASWGY